jgi:hypothetical protein
LRFHEKVYGIFGMVASTEQTGRKVLRGKLKNKTDEKQIERSR